MHYTSLNEYLKSVYGHKLYKISLNANLTCPNRDGHLSFSGCTFCSEGGSGDFAESASHTISMQIEEGKRKIKNKMPKNLSSSPSYIAYFQAFTNTYGPIDYLRKIFYEAVEQEEIAILSIATRPDCLGPDILDLLSELNQIKPVWIELGLQTIHPETARRINRGYPLSVYDQAVTSLRERNIKVITHLIIGLPGETESMIYQSVAHVVNMNTWGIKLQLLHVLKGTRLAKQYETNPFHILSLEEYTHIIVECLKRIPESVVIHRITGDGPKSILMEPKWSANKKLVLNTLQKAIKLSERN